MVRTASTEIHLSKCLIRISVYVHNRKWGQLDLEQEVRQSLLFDGYENSRFLYHTVALCMLINISAVKSTAFSSGT